MKKKRSSNASSGDRKRGSQRTPMRGGALSQLASAFRLRQLVLADNAEVSEGTAKHGFNDHHDIGHARHVMLLRPAVDALFTMEYLAARGLEGGDATRHNDLVAQALEVVLARWDRVAIFMNAAPELNAQTLQVVHLATRFSVEVGLRMAAYEALYGYVHPFLSNIPAWLKAPKLKGWWSAIELRASKPIKVSLLYEKGELDSHTIRNIKAGNAFPKEGTVRALAQRLAEHSIRAWDEERAATAAEVELELRVAVAAAEHPDVIFAITAESALEGWAMQLRVFRDVLQSAPDTVAADLLLKGVDSAWWPQTEARFHEILTAQMAMATRRMKLDADRRMGMAQTDPVGASRDLTKELHQHASELRAFDPLTGADHPGLRVAEVLASQAKLMLALATNTEPIFTIRPELNAEMKADQLCLEAKAPWPKLSDDEKEARLREAVGVCDWSSFAHRELADQLEVMGKADEALVHYRRSVELNPENDGGRTALVLRLADRNQHEEVLALTEHHQASLVLRAVRAYALLGLGDAPAAERLAKGVVEEHPMQSIALRVLAGCARAKGDERKAREYEQRVALAEHGLRPPGG